MATTPEHVACNLCGADETRLLYSLRDYRLRVDDRLWDLVQCRSCSLGYLDPRPTADEIGIYYPESYFSHRGGMSRLHAQQAAYVPEARGDLLDIGAARGDFLAVMRDRGWRVTGIEPSTTQNPYGLTIYRRPFPDDGELGHECFDVITAWAVFEHLHDPAAAFARVAELLRPGGRFILLVPNLRSINARYAQLEDILRHLYVYSPRTLRKYGQRFHLTLRRVEHTTMYGGSGRGVLRRGLIRMIGGDTDAFFAFYRMKRRERFRASPLLAAVWTVIGVFERVAMPNWLIRACRMSGEIVVVMDKAIGLEIPVPKRGEERVPQDAKPKPAKG